MLCILMTILWHASTKKKKAYGFQISLFYWSFSDDIMAMKELRIIIFIVQYHTYFIKKEKGKKLDHK